MDLIIVIGGIIEEVSSFFSDNLEEYRVLSLLSLRLLRIFRFFRILRLLKVVRYFIDSDLSWTEGPAFESFIMLVIVLNTCVIGLELDVPWEGWSYAEQIMLSIYTFELAVRLKHAGWRFFDAAGCAWNYLDITIVGAGVAELWVMPLSCFVRGSFGRNFECTQTHPHSKSILSMVRVMRLLRVLRLVRLVKSVKPLHRLLLGVVEALQGMQWVLLLTVILLYAAAIIFTSLIGHGYMYGGQAPQEAKDMFGTVPQSMFALFKLMNDDQSVVYPIIFSWEGLLLFAGFMVISNWAILAILTSVVSDSMIAASQRVEQEEFNWHKHVQHEAQNRRLVALFKEIDQDGSGALDQQEFMDLLSDQALCEELCGASGLSVSDLVDLFNCLSVNKDGQGRILQYNDFISQLQDEGKNADKRSVLHVITFLRAMEKRLVSRLDKVVHTPGNKSERCH